MNSTFTARWNEALIDENYERWMENPRSVDSDWAAFFEGFELGSVRDKKNGTAAAPPAREPAYTQGDDLHIRIEALVRRYRALGHTISDLDPLGEAVRENALLALDEFGFTEADLEKTVSSSRFHKGQEMKLGELIAELKRIYCGKIGAEFSHIEDPKTRDWVRNRFENRDSAVYSDADTHRYVLKTIYEAETFESFIETKFGTEKRFSLEGGESLIVALRTIFENSEKHGVKELVMGMAHRGRLNVLANFLGKQLEIVLNEFSDIFHPDMVGGNGDVKYHLGYQTIRPTLTGYEVGIRLAANPSHLEAVDPVVQGKARARQRILDDSVERKKVVPLLIHGDAAFIGQGVVAEVFNMSQLPGYRTGGTIHIVVNNQIGFTTLPADARSTRYCTDIAKMVDAPIFHVNGDEPLAVLEVAEIALEFRQKFGRDVVIDIYCYRRFGHNEVDEPSYTQPNMYSKIREHPRLSDVFVSQITPVSVSVKEAAALRDAAMEELNVALINIKNEAASNKKSEFTGSTAIFQPPYSHEPVNTAISREMLDQIAKALTTLPEDFKMFPRLKSRWLDRRLNVWQEGGPFNWAYGEALAFGSLLLEGTPVRLSGQDSRRGTFTQRHSVFYDAITRERYIPLLNLGPNQARFCVYNSPLSEYAVLGFDYGYSMDFPSMLCLWEAQFGDFTNGAQIIVDQFIASAEAKWQRPSSIVLLLPHGYEGMGPEHSSARLERFLQLCADNNMQVCNLTTSAQYFHALRRQIHRGYRKPLIIMTPKSLLGDDRAGSRVEDFTNSRFYEILADKAPANDANVKRIIYCTGKVYYDLDRYRTENSLVDEVAIIRIEQLYPLNEEKLLRIAKPYTAATKIVWCQEEPENMGAWTFMMPRLQKLLGRPIEYAGRPASAVTAVGSKSMHKKQEAALVKQAFEV